MRIFTKILMFALVASWSTQAAQSQTVVMCIGDSITEGVYVSVPWPNRLARNTGYTVINAGIGGERSYQGLARIDALLALHDPSNVLILYGTNDIGKPGADLWDAANIVLQIALRVRAYGAVPVIGTPPPFFYPKIWNIPRVEEFNGYLRSLAAANRIRLADVQLAFGTNSGLMISDGFHPNDSGMEVIARTFAPYIVPYVLPLPSKPLALAPKGLVPFTPRPTFSWTPAAYASSYVLTLYRNGVLFQNQNVSGTTWTPATDLTCASYSWQVAGKNARGTGPASEPVAMIHQDANCCIPLAPFDLRTVPVGRGQVQYSWRTDRCATEYRLWIQHNGATWSTNWHVAATNGGRAAVVLPNHAVGDYRWWVQGRSADGTGEWSVGHDYGYGAPVPVAPTGRMVAVPNQFVWNDLASYTADRYLVWLSRDNEPVWTPWIDSTATLDLGGTNRSTARPAELEIPYGTYTWWMQAAQGAALGPWSAGATFTRGQPAPTGPTGKVGVASVKFTWDDSATRDATWYQIWITRNGEFFNERWLEVDGTESLPGLIRAYPLTDAPPYGNYAWWMRAWKPGGMGPWAPGTAFERGYAKPVHPTGATLSGQRVFSWEDTYSQDASWFHLWIAKDGVALWNGWFSRADAFHQNAQNIGLTGTWGTYWAHALPASVELSPGHYTWWIRPWRDPSVGNWSEGLSFTISN